MKNTQYTLYVLIQPFEPLSGKVKFEKITTNIFS